MKYTNAKDALNWLINNPNKKLYDKWYNYYVLSEYGNYIEFHHYEIDFDEDSNDISFWDYDLENFTDFLDNNIELETE